MILASRGERLSSTLAELGGEELPVDDLGGLGGVDVLDEVADGGLAVLADRGVEADRLAAGAQQLLDLVGGLVQLTAELLGRGLPAEPLVHVALDPGQLGQHLQHVHGQPDRAGRVGEAALDGLPDPPHGVGGELVALGVVELLHGADQAEVALLHHVEQGHAAVGVLLGDRDDQAQVGLQHVVLGAAAVLGDPLQVVAVLVGQAAARSPACTRRTGRPRCAWRARPPAAAVSRVRRPIDFR